MICMDGHVVHGRLQYYVVPVSFHLVTWAVLDAGRAHSTSGGPSCGSYTTEIPVARIESRISLVAHDAAHGVKVRQASRGRRWVALPEQTMRLYWFA